MGQISGVLEGPTVRPGELVVLACGWCDHFRFQKNIASNIAETQHHFGCLGVFNWMTFRLVGSSVTINQEREHTWMY